MRTLVSLYFGLKQHEYTEQDGHKVTDHTGSYQDAFWIGFLIFGMFLIGGACK